MDIKIVFTLIGVAIIVFGEIVYIREILKGNVKPHPFTWLGWSIITGFVAVAQMSDGGGYGVAILATESLITFFIFLLSLKFGEKQIYFSDHISFALGVASMLLWYVTSTPLWSVLLITVADVLMFVPTIRKTFTKPFDENLFEYYTSSCAYIVSFFALSNISLITFFYPGVLVILNGIFIIFTLAIRRSFANMQYASVYDTDEDELYDISKRSACAQDREILIYEKYSLNELIGVERANEIRDLIRENGITVRQITNEEDLDMVRAGIDEEYLGTNHQIRYVDKKIFDIQNEILVFDDVVSVYDVDANNKITIIQNKNFANNQKQLFNQLWNADSEHSA